MNSDQPNREEPVDPAELQVVKDIDAKLAFLLSKKPSHKELADNRRMLQEARDAIALKSDKINVLMEDLKDKDRIIEDKDRIIADLQQQLEELAPYKKKTYNFFKTTQAYGEDIEKIRREKKKLEMLLDQAVNDVRRLNVKNDDVTKHLNKAKTDLGRVKVELGKAKRSLEERDQEIRGLRMRVGDEEDLELERLRLAYFEGLEKRYRKDRLASPRRKPFDEDVYLDRFSTPRGSARRQAARRPTPRDSERIPVYLGTESPVGYMDRLTSPQKKRDTSGSRHNPRTRSNSPIYRGARGGEFPYRYDGGGYYGYYDNRSRNFEDTYTPYNYRNRSSSPESGSPRNCTKGPSCSSGGLSRPAAPLYLDVPDFKTSKIQPKAQTKRSVKPKMFAYNGGFPSYKPSEEEEAKPKIEEPSDSKRGFSGFGTPELAKAERDMEEEEEEEEEDEESEEEEEYIYEGW